MDVNKLENNLFRETKPAGRESGFQKTQSRVYNDPRSKLKNSPVPEKVLTPA
jgi:hypothetical protein